MLAFHCFSENSSYGVIAFYGSPNRKTEGPFHNRISTDAKKRNPFRHPLLIPTVGRLSAFGIELPVCQGMFAWGTRALILEYQIFYSVLRGLFSAFPFHSSEHPAGTGRHCISLVGSNAFHNQALRLKPVFYFQISIGSSAPVGSDDSRKPAPHFPCPTAPHQSPSTLSKNCVDFTGFFAFSQPWKTAIFGLFSWHRP